VGCITVQHTAAAWVAAAAVAGLCRSRQPQQRWVVMGIGSAAARLLGPNVRQQASRSQAVSLSAAGQQQSAKLLISVVCEALCGGVAASTAVKIAATRSSRAVWVGVEWVGAIERGSVL
jgi:hypothetical protein